jgi:hypothetical protein
VQSSQIGAGPLDGGEVSSRPASKQDVFFACYEKRTDLATSQLASGNRFNTEGAEAHGVGRFSQCYSVTSVFKG